MQLNGPVARAIAESQADDRRAYEGLGPAWRLAADRVWVRGRSRFAGEVFTYDVPGQDRVLSRAEVAAALRAQAPRFDLLGRFARWLEDTDDYPCPGEQASEDLRVVAAMLRALESGRSEDV